MDTSGFYKLEDQVLLYGHDVVYNSDYLLTRETKDLFTYPHYEWYWFDSAQEAHAFFGLEYTEPAAPPTETEV